MKTLETLAGAIAAAWDWLVGLEGGLQSALVLACMIGAAALVFAARALARPSYASPAAGGRVALSVAAYVGGFVLAVLSVAGIAAAFVPLLS